MMQVQGIGNTTYQPINPIQPITIKIDLSGVQNPNGVTNPIQSQELKQEPVQQAQQQPAVYNYPEKSLYDIPQASIYGPTPMTNPIKKENPAAYVIPPQLLNPTFTEATPVVQTKVAEAVSAAAPTEVKAQIKAETKEDKGVKSENTSSKDVKRPEIVAPEPVKPIVDLDELVAILLSPNYEDQADAMEAISQAVLIEPDKSQDLIDPKVIDTLLGIINKDTSVMNENEKALAERNKQYAMYTTATLQKLYTEEIQKAAETTVPIEEVVGMAGIVNELKTNSNPQIRDAAVTALDYVKRPEYKQDLAQLFFEASKDKDVTVRTNAQQALNKLV